MLSAPMRRTCFPLTCWVLLCAAWLLACPTAQADPPPFLVEKSISPDGSMELFLTPSAKKKDEDGAYTAKITVRGVQSREVLGEFDWRSIGEAPDGTTLSVLWSPDSHSFALHWEDSFGVACAVYARSSSGWQPVPLPNDLPQRARAKAEATEGRIEVDSNAAQKGNETVTKWLPDRCFRVQGEYAGIWKVKEENNQQLQLFWYTFRLEGGQGNDKLRAVLQSVEFAPASTQSTL